MTGKVRGLNTYLGHGKMSSKRRHLPAERIGTNASWSCRRNEELLKQLECLPGNAAQAPGWKAGAFPEPRARKEAPAKGAEGEHKTCTQQPAGEVSFIDGGSGCKESLPKGWETILAS